MMAKHSYEKARWKRREARRKRPANGWNRWWQGSVVWSPPGSEKWPQQVQQAQRKLDASVHHGPSGYTRRCRKLWRRQAHMVEGLHLHGAHGEAENLDPQPRRLGVMWAIW
ncbi:hypothetical protein [Deinococcus fonticola]|uniref:hypothetical protein n=1 Tax=Deinococcus fonticola TaxID=2528713 RepID=UPI001074ABC2|nr:hypothetical protein [Deinococcus fonticola]